MAPPKKEAAADGANSEHCVKGFDSRETKILASAFLSQIGHDKYDYEVMAELTKNTVGTLKKYLPKVKTKAMELSVAFDSFIKGTSGGNAGKAVPAKAAANKGTKRKAENDADVDDIKAEASDESATVTEDKDEPVKKKVAGKGKGRGKKPVSDAEADGVEKEKPKAKPPRGKKAKSEDEAQENGGSSEVKKKPAAKKPRGKAAAKKVETEEKEDTEDAGEEKEE